MLNRRARLDCKKAGIMAAKDQVRPANGIGIFQHITDAQIFYEQYSRLATGKNTARQSIFRLNDPHLRRIESVQCLAVAMYLPPMQAEILKLCLKPNLQA